MKDFIKWLGVNEKVAKVVVWIMIIMVMLIIINAALNSLGFPHYQITYENLKHINNLKFLNYLSSWIITVLNFYAIMLLVFRVNDIKKLFKYAIIYLIFNIIITVSLNDGIAQIFIFLSILLIGYIYSNKNKKYILYIIISLVINTLIEGITYYFKIRFIDYANISYSTKFLISIDYFIIMAVIILVKEIYLKKRGEKDVK